MILCGIDASSTSTGIAIINGDNLTFHTTINLKHVKDKQSRVNQMMEQIGNVISEYNPDCLYVEDSWSAANVEVTKTLSNIIGAIMYVCVKTGTGFNKLRPSEWRKVIGLELGKKKRDELKEEAVKYVKDTYGFEVGDDEAEAICIADAAYLLTDGGSIFG